MNTATEPRVILAGPEPLIESLEWRPEAEKPDAGTTVLCWSDADGFFCGWWDDESRDWLACESGGVALGVTHWCEPQGPTP